MLIVYLQVNFIQNLKKFLQLGNLKNASKLKICGCKFCYKCITKYLERDKDALNCPNCNKLFWNFGSKECVEIDKNFDQVNGFFLIYLLKKTTFKAKDYKNFNF